MIRAILGVLGGLTAVVPDRIVDAFERVAVANPDEVEPRSRLLPTLRAEGAFIVAIALTGGRAYAWTMYVSGAFGALLLAFPRLYREVAARFVYDDPDAVEWNAGFDRVLRSVGALYVLWGLRELRRRRGAE
ncbi:hypothetical protein [Halorubrum kocurii]|uniref:DoxX family protein n=1 Tax=Halorubrum kocurii JCM 14978 TaxID=1230456 RepID=M0P2L2_9EURY|nr:hypothetical protein [Halorubrum kocurii]EMA64331.1 hypothetical protein C468_08746 [Halorubrum kocurii JCM 14978]